MNKLNKVVKQIDKISVSRLYDFIDATIETEEVENDKLDITFVVKESEKFYVKKINVIGNNITEERVIRDMLEVDEGDPFNKLLHAKSLNNMRGRNIFQSVKSDIVDTQDGKLKNINIIVEEKATGEVLVGAGVGTEGGTAQFSISENNFLGKGVKLSTGLRVSEERLRGNFTVTNPNFNYTEKALSTDIFITDTDKLEGSGFKSTDAGFSFGTAFEQYDDFYFRPNFSTVYEQLTTNSSASESLKKQEGSYFTSTFGYSLDLDKETKDSKHQKAFNLNLLKDYP